MKVSVLMVTYNHEKYITQAVESVLMQETSFDVELVIGEDCSTDRTREILLDLQARQPDKIRLLPSEGRLGVNANIARTLHACTGQYVAFLDGDDYWTSPHKLQKQADYLDRHPEITVCFHNAAIVNLEGTTVLRHGVKPDQKPVSTLEDILRKNVISSCTAMYRHGLVQDFPDWWFNLLNADWTLHIFHAQHGQIGYLPELMAAYRFNPDGIWRRLAFEDRLRVRIRSYTAINKYLNYRYDSVIRPTLADHWRRLALVYVDKGLEAGREDARLQSVMNVFSDWPQDLPCPRRWKAQVLAETYERLLFLHHQRGQWRPTGRCCVQLALRRPTRFRNRGILKACVDAFAGAYVPGLRMKY